MFQDSLPTIATSLKSSVRDGSAVTRCVIGAARPRLLRCLSATRSRVGHFHRAQLRKSIQLTFFERSLDGTNSISETP